MSINDKCYKIPKSVSLDSFTEKSEPNMHFKVLCTKHEDYESSGSSSNKNLDLSINIDKLTNVVISSNCHLYISMLLLPEAKRELKQKTQKGKIHILICLLVGRLIQKRLYHLVPSTFLNTLML